MQDTNKTEGLGSQLGCLLKPRKPTPSGTSINGNSNHMSLLSKGAVGPALSGSRDDSLTQERALCPSCGASRVLAQEAQLPGRTLSHKGKMLLFFLFKTNHEP